MGQLLEAKSERLQERRHVDRYLCAMDFMDWASIGFHYLVDRNYYCLARR
jgi:hypothetical protein